MKNRLLLILLIGIFIFSLGNIISEDENDETEQINLGEMLNNSAINITGIGFEFLGYETITERQKEYPYEEYSYQVVAIKLSSEENPSEINIGKNKLENIVSRTRYEWEDGPDHSFLINPVNNEIISADFSVGKGGGEYVLGDTDFSAEENSRVEYNQKEGKLSVYRGKIKNRVDEIPEGIKSIFGADLEFAEGFTLDGEVFTNVNLGNSYLLKTGILEYKGFEVGSRHNSNQRIIFSSENNLEMQTGEYDPSFNYIIGGGNSVKFISNSERLGAFQPDIDQFKDNEILGLTKEEISQTKFNIYITSGDSLEIISQQNNPPKFILKKSVGTEDIHYYGKSGLINDGHSISFNENNELSTKMSTPSYYELTTGKYFPIEIELETRDEEGNLKNEFILNSEGEFSLIDQENKNRVIYTRYGLSNILKEGLTAQTISDYENIFDIYYKDSFSLDAATTRRTISDLASAGISPKDTDLLLESISSKKESGQVLYSDLFLLNKINDEASYLGVEKSKMLDFSEKIILSEGATIIGNNQKFISLAVREFDGKNADEIIEGAVILSKYTGYYSSGFATLAEKSGIKFSDIKDKSSLAESFSKGLNSFSKTSSANEQADVFKKAAVLINQMHDQEGNLDSSDTIRESISKNLNFESKYFLINHANSDLYQSTFDKLYENFPENSVQRIKQEIDPEGKYWANFVLSMASRDRTNDLIDQDSEFFLQGIDKALEEQDTFSLARNVVFLTNTFEEYYKNPKYIGEKEYFENFLVDKYHSEEDSSKKALYGYLIKLNEDSCNSEIKEKYSQICDELPEIPNLDIPSSWTEDNTIAAKLYFYDDESWFGITKKQYTNPPYNFKLNEEKSTKNTAILEKESRGYKLKIVLTLDNSDVDDAVNGEEFDIISHRGHSFHLSDTFNSRSDSTKLFYLGSCGSYGQTPRLQSNYPNAYLISDENTGQGNTNNRAIIAIMENLLQGASDWDSLRTNVPEGKGLVFPNDKNQLVLRFIQQVKEELVNN